ncbi:MAG: hypothetical protein GX224_02360 [Thermoplasmatales archaeon]|nr:hypothetical protein [Thermoplasmatales archaeon]
MDGKTLLLAVAGTAMVFAIAGVFFVEVQEQVPFEIAFRDWDGKTISVGEYGRYDAIEVPADPSRPPDERRVYSFVGWDPAIPELIRGDMTFTAVYSASERLYDVSVSSGDPDLGDVAASGGRFPYETAFTASASPKEGCRFVSWTLNGAKMDCGAECPVTVTGDVELVANFAIEYDASFSVSTESGFNVFPATVLAVAEENPFAVRREWRVMDVFGDNHGVTGPTLISERIDDADPGPTYEFGLDSVRCVEVTHSVTYSDGHTETAVAMHIVDGEFSKEFTWYYPRLGLQTTTLEGLSYSDYAATKYENMKGDLVDDTGWGEKSDYFFARPDANISMLADRLKELSAGFTDLQTAQYLAHFVSFTTKYDYVEYAECVEFQRTPVETMFEGVGDCEDTAYYYAALAREFDLDFIIIILTYTYDGEMGLHAEVAVNVPCESGHYLEFGGKRYFYTTVGAMSDYFDPDDAESTGYWLIGELPYDTVLVHSVFASDMTFEKGLDMVPVSL